MRVHIPMLPVLFMGVTLWAQAEPTTQPVAAIQILGEAKAKYSEIVQSYCTKGVEEISERNARPDGQIAQNLRKLYEILQSVSRLPDEGEEDSVFLDLAMFEARVVEAVNVLQQRQLYRYLWWVEAQLLRYTTGLYENIENCSERELIWAYRELSKIDLSLVTESMVAREIAALMGRIYDKMSGDAKRAARRYGIRIRHDVYSESVSSEEFPRLIRPEEF